MVSRRVRSPAWLAWRNVRVAATGTLVLGTGKDPRTDPFKVSIRLRVDGGSITYEIDAEPWAIVRDKRGIGLGRTPLGPMPGETLITPAPPVRGAPWGGWRAS